MTAPPLGVAGARKGSGRFGAFEAEAEAEIVSIPGWAPAALRGRHPPETPPSVEASAPRTRVGGVGRAAGSDARPSAQAATSAPSCDAHPTLATEGPRAFMRGSRPVRACPAPP